MKLSFIASPVWALALAQFAAATQVKIDVDVAIFGGGSAGIHAAIQLRDAGATVAVIEKKSQIGGHAETYTDPQGKSTNVGVVVFDNIEVASNYFARLNVSIVRGSPLGTAGPTYTYDFTSGAQIPAVNTSAEAQQQLTAALQSYSTNVLSKYPWIDEGFLVPDPVPEELTIPFGELAQKYNFTALMPTIAMYNYFTGDLSTIPSLYGIKGLGQGALKNLFGSFILPASGKTRDLYDAAAIELGNSVLLNADVVKVQRDVRINSTTTGVTVLIQQPGQPPKLIRARKLLVAAPPTLENVGAFDLTAEERGLISKFSSLGCWASVANVPGLNVTLKNYGVHMPYNQPSIPGPYGFVAYGSPNNFLVTVGLPDAANTAAKGEAVVRQSLATLSAVGAVPADALEKLTFPFSAVHSPYSLRVSAEEIKAGFYSKFLALEGARNTYWTGAVWAGHNSALIWNFNMGTVLPGLKKDLGL
ncbi:flavin-containing superfamily Amine oxidase [Colletotrichum higginsianum]|uniref:FAD-dependent oxidoreductase dpchF n=3 Tax=Colletotrichum higginsianum TaxID=80884 RepID=DPCHF_COLHI|nr:Flavin-containing superfamily Amine oxidase [Colletotrichum higginsianum IMI 349063]H1VQW0.1 RecName: Full=FAD-dependent oxidoreductase dpchF; AltName: Full=Diterpenoid pyrone biosynthesis cluster protein F; Flags: Precursor [Colletotrichum higginsianum IMI 349063]OBR09790.1 Flavin-containing superfamily Amine oxidase [Colletotrichum higginsianum IMI 349063]TID06103.1 Beta-cyclopiazonate dehydrogenase [Colletotrichum higginsianum]CCF42616.1 flavin-containing superfamily Amine oxidase [Collet